MALEPLKEQLKLIIWKCNNCGNERPCEYSCYIPSSKIDWLAPGKLQIAYFGCPMPGEINPFPRSRWKLDRILDPIQEKINEKIQEFTVKRLNSIAKYCRVKLNHGKQNIETKDILKIIDGSLKPGKEDVEAST